jgi:hypothetical protein
MIEKMKNTKSKLIRALLSLATTAFSLSFLLTYIYLFSKPSQTNASKEILSLVSGWFFSIFCVVLVSLLGMAWNFIKVLKLQKTSLLTIPDSFNPFFRFTDKYLKEEGKDSRNNFVIFFIAFVIAFGNVPILIWLTHYLN